METGSNPAFTQPCLPHLTQSYPADCGPLMLKVSDWKVISILHQSIHSGNKVSLNIYTYYIQYIFSLKKKF